MHVEKIIYTAKNDCSNHNAVFVALVTVFSLKVSIRGNFI